MSVMCLPSANAYPIGVLSSLASFRILELHKRMECGHAHFGRFGMIIDDPEYRNALQLVEVLREALTQLEVDAAKIDAGFYQDIRQLYSQQRSALASEIADYRTAHQVKSDAEQATWTSLRQAQHFISIARRDIFHLRERLQASQGESMRDLDRLAFYQEMLVLHEELLEEWEQRKHDIERQLFANADPGSTHSPSHGQPR